MDALTEAKKDRIRERDRIRQHKAYHSDPEVKARLIAVNTLRRQDPAVRARRNAVELERYYRNKALNANKENIEVN